MQSAIKTLVSVSKEFGLTVASRKRNKISTKSETDNKSSIFNMQGDNNFDMSNI